METISELIAAVKQRNGIQPGTNLVTENAPAEPTAENGVTYPTSENEITYPTSENRITYPTSENR